MGRRIFSGDYYVLEQKRFEVALREERLEDAIDILEGLPQAHNPQDTLLRARTLIDGYRAIVEVVKTNFVPSERLEKIQDELNIYKENLGALQGI